MKVLNRFLKRLLSFLPKRQELAIERNNTGVTLAQDGLIDDAIVNFKAATDLNPREAAYWGNLGSALQNSGKAKEACKIYEQGSRCKNAPAPLFDNWGMALASLDRLSESVAAHRKAIALDPDFSSALVNLGNTYRVMGQLSDALMSMDAAVTKAPGDPYIAGARLYTLNFMPELSAQDIADAHRTWPGGDLQVAVTFPNDRDPDRRLKIGYVSSDFRMHACANFLLPLIQAHDRGRVHVTGFATVNASDALTEAFSSAVDDWIDVTTCNEAAFVNAVRARHIDILIDCGGHTTSSKLGAFTQRLAPVQVSWLGYPNTTGLKAMDYRLTDKVCTPREMSTLFSETLKDLPSGFHTYRPLKETPDPSPPPCIEQGHVTFGVIHNLAKLSNTSLALWASLLKDLPDSRLYVKAKALADESVEQSFRIRCEQAGLDTKRVSLHPWSPSYLDIFSDLANVDVVLDATPYNGTTSTCDALWMGVPVVTLCGDRPSARVGASLLTQIGHPEWIANTDDEYVGIAKQLAGDKAALENLRANLRQDILQSSLGNAARFADTVEQAYRSMWQSWCQNQAA